MRVQICLEFKTSCQPADRSWQPCLWKLILVTNSVTTHGHVLSLGISSWSVVPGPLENYLWEWTRSLVGGIQVPASTVTDASKSKLYKSVLTWEGQKQILAGTVLHLSKSYHVVGYENKQLGSA